MGYLLLVVTLVGTAYSQLIIKWRVDDAGDLPDATSGRVDFFGRLLSDPWMLTAVVALIVAALCWLAALTQIELSRAYPFVMGLSFALVIGGSAAFFSEPVTFGKGVGVALIVTGIGIATQT